MRDRAVDLEQLERLLDPAARQVDGSLQLRHGRRVDGLERPQDFLHVDGRRERVPDEVVGDLVVLAARQQDPVGAIDRPPRPADLLVVGNRRARPLVVDDPAEVGLVEAHPERDGRDQGLDVAVDEGVLERLALGRRQVGVVGARVDAARRQPRGDPLAVGDRQAVHDAAAWQFRDLVGEPGEALGLVGERDRIEPQRATGQRPADDLDALAQLIGDVGNDAVVRGRGRGEDRDARRQGPQEPADAAIVGPEVVAPVGDAVGLVDDEQPDCAADLRQHAGDEVGVAEALGRDQQDVDRVGRDGLLDRRPLVDITRVDRVRPQPEPAGHRDLVAHERKQGTDDQRRSVALVASDPRRDPVDEALAPAGPLDDERPPAVTDDRLDCFALSLAELGVGTEHGLQMRLESGVVGRDHRPSTAGWYDAASSLRAGGSGRSRNDRPWGDRMAPKWRRSSVTMRSVSKRSARTATEASVVPIGKSP